MHTAIGILANKGGVTKSTTAVNLAYCAATVTGKNVVLIDLDPQANATRSMGVRNASGEGINRVLADGQPILDHAIHLADTVSWDPAAVPDNLWLLAGGPDAAQAKTALASAIDKNFHLAEALDDLDDNWIAVIDTGPDFSALTSATQLAATDIIVPGKPDLADYEGALRMWPIINNNARRFQREVNIAGLLIARFDRRNKSNVQRDVVAGARSNQAIEVFDTVIRDSARVVESYGVGQPVAAYWPDASAAQDYLAATIEFLTVRSAAARAGQPIPILSDRLPEPLLDEAAV